MDFEDKKNRLFKQVSMGGGELNENFSPSHSSSEEKLKYLIERLEMMVHKHEKMLNENHVIPKSSQDVYIVIGNNKFKGKLELMK